MIDPRTLPTSWRDSAALLQAQVANVVDPTLEQRVERERMLSIANAYRQCAAELEATLPTNDGEVV